MPNITIHLHIEDDSPERAAARILAKLAGELANGFTIERAPGTFAPYVYDENDAEVGTIELSA